MAKHLIWAAVVFGLVLLAGLYVDSVAHNELTQSIRFVVQAVSLASAAGLVVSVAGWGAILYFRAHEARARAHQARYEAIKSAVLVNIAGPGEQVYLTQLAGIETTTKPLHLSPAQRINGPGSLPTEEEVRRWAFWQITNRQPAQLAGMQPPLLPAAVSAWPAKVNLFDLLPDGRGDLSNIVLGITVNETTGQQQLISAGLERMVHVAVGGASGWGKSEFMRGFAYQVATAPQAAQLALVDMEAATFTPLANSARLRYPIADTEQDVLAILADLQDEMRRRKGLYQQHPTADKLSSYNALAEEPLPVIVLLIEEATALLAHRDVERAVKELVLRARKYGIFTIAGGQSWKASDFDSAIRGQFSSLVHFHAKDKSSSRVLLGDPAAADIDQVGRAYAVLPGQPMIQLQAPALSLFTVARALGDRQGPPPAMPAAPEPEPDGTETQILTLARQGFSKAKICEAVWGYKSSKMYPRIDETLARYGVHRAPDEENEAF